MASHSFRQGDKIKAAEDLITKSLIKYGQVLPLLIEQAEIAGAHKNWPEASKCWQTILDEFSRSGLPDTDKLLCRFNLSILNRLNNLTAYKKQIADYKKAKSNKKRVVIYTAVSKGYDSLKLPEIINPDFDYVCFTDDPSIEGFGVFDIRPFPVIAADPARTIRYPKTHSHVLFKNYLVAAWLDTNIMITNDITPLIDKFLKSGKPLGSGVPRPGYVSLEDGYWACVNLMKDDLEIMKKQMETYKKDGITNPDFAENGVLLFRPSDSKLAEAMKIWWEQIQKFSKRDQLSFGYSIAKAGLNWFRINQPPSNILNNPDLVLSPHHSNNSLLDELYKQLR